MDRRNTIAGALALAIVPAALLGLGASAQEPKKDGPGEQIGKALDKAGKAVREGLKETRETIRERLAAAREGIDNLNVESRVYARLHWDKDLASGTFEVSVEDGTATLKGQVPDAPARAKAVKLAGETVGVAKVLDELVVEPRTDLVVPKPVRTEEKAAPRP